MMQVETKKNMVTGTIAIKPFVDSNSENMGLENYNLAIFPGTFHEESIACLEQNGIRRYLTGLNEFAPELKKIKDKKMRDAIIQDIRNTVAELEKELDANVIDPDPENKKFWEEVNVVRPDNYDFWEKIVIRCGNEPVWLDPSNPYDLIKIKAIEAGGISIVAKSWDDALNSAKPPKFYLDRQLDTVATRTESKKLRNKALSELDKLYTKNANKLMYVCKVVDAYSAQYKKSTPLDIMYENMDNFINGEGVEKSANRAATAFLDASQLDMETLKLKCIVKDSSFYKFIGTKADGMIYHMDKVVVLGRNAQDVVEFLRNPLNEDILVDLQEKVEGYWND
jgi:hypothetical protein